VVSDDIHEVGIRDDGGLFIRPASQTFPYIYREAMEVMWDEEAQQLHGPRPREWSLADWSRHVVDAAAQQGVALRLTPATRWTNVPADVREAIKQRLKM
jgi:Integron Cassette Protein Hfx_Cass5